MSANIETGVEKGVSVEVYSALEAKFNTLSESHKKLFEEGEKFKVERMLDKLEMEHYQFDRPEAMEILVSRDEAGRTKFSDFMKKNCKQIKNQEVEVLQSEATEGGGGKGGISASHYGRALNWMIKEGKSDMAAAIEATKAG